MTTATRTHTVSLWDRYIQGRGLTLTLAAFVVLAVAYPVQDARWVRDLAPLVAVGLASLLATAVLEARRIRPLRAHVSSAVIGIVAALASGVAMIPGATVVDRAGNLFSELDAWAAAVPSNEIRGGIVEFGMFLVLVTWMLGHVAGWLALRRRQAWSAVLLGGAVLSIALTNIGSDTTISLVLFMAASVLLLIHMATSRRMVRWRAGRLAFDPTTVLTQSGIILTLGLVIVVAVSAIPTPSAAPLGAVADALEETSDGAAAEFGRLFNGLPSRRTFTVISFDDDTMFQGNPNLTDELLFTVDGPRTGEYWRARTYTTYAGVGWESEGAEFGPPVESGAEDIRRIPATYRFRVSAATDTFFTAGLPASIDRPADALVFEDAPDDVLQLRIAQGRDYFPARTNLRYRSVGNRSLVQPATLQEASGEYPEAVAERYLQLPETLPQRVYDLAEEITDGEESDYDKAEAVRAYVSSFPYNLDIQAPPRDADGVDYFLFNLQQGYCDYYASSAAVLLRTIGIPARYVLGYTSGRYDSSSQQYRVLDLHYHAWTEVYFPEYGWIMFEPTPPNGIEFDSILDGSASQPLPPPNAGGAGSLDDEEEEEEFDLLTDFTPTERFEFNVRALVLAFSALVVVVLSLSYYRIWWSLNRFERADELYAKMARLGSLLGVPQRRGQTPYDYAGALLVEAPEGGADFACVASAYAGNRYSGKPIPMREVTNAEEAWSRLRWILLKRMFRVTPS